MYIMFMFKLNFWFDTKSIECLSKKKTPVKILILRHLNRYICHVSRYQCLVDKNCSRSMQNVVR